MIATNCAGMTVHWGHPAQDGAMWSLFKHCARQAYARRDCEEPHSWLDREASVARFCLISDAEKYLAGFVVRRVRLGSLLAPDAWGSRQPVLDALTAVVRTDEWIAEAVSAWSDDRRASEVLATQSLAALILVGCRWMVATSAQHSVSLWMRSGASRLAGLPPVAYPDERYQTELLIWDRNEMRESVDHRLWTPVLDQVAELILNGHVSGLVTDSVGGVSR